MFKPTDRQIANWKKIVEGGMWRYIKLNFIAFGINMVLFTLAVHYIQEKPIAIKLLLTKENLTESLLFGLLGGVIFAFGSWFLVKSRYSKNTKK